MMMVAVVIVAFVLMMGYAIHNHLEVRIHIPFIVELEGPILENILRKAGNFEADAEEQERYYKIALEGMAA